MNKKIENNNTQKLFNICVDVFPFLSEGEKNKRIFKRLQILEVITANSNWCNRALKVHALTKSNNFLASERFTMLDRFIETLSHDIKGLSVNDVHFLPRI